MTRGNSGEDAGFTKHVLLHSTGSREALRDLGRRGIWCHLHFSSVTLAVLQGKDRGRETYLKAEAVIRVDGGGGEEQQAEGRGSGFWMYLKEKAGQRSWWMWHVVESSEESKEMPGLAQVGARRALLVGAEETKGKPMMGRQCPVMISKSSYMSSMKRGNHLRHGNDTL